MKAVSLIVVNRNGAGVFSGEQSEVVFRHYAGKTMLEGCLSALGEDPHWELLVVDNGSTDGSVALIRTRFSSAQLLANPDNRGFAPAVCQAAALAQGRYLLLVNSDVLIDPPRIRRLLEEMEARPRLGVLSCRTVYPGGTLQRPACRALTPGLVLSQLLGLSRLFPSVRSFNPLSLDFDPDRYGEPDWVAGGLMLIRREAWDAVEGFDPSFVFYEEDADLCLRMRRLGWGVGYTPEVTAMHVRAMTAGSDPVFSLIHRYRSLLRYSEKHFPGPAVLLIRTAVLGRMLLRAAWAILRGEGWEMVRASLRAGFTTA